MIGFIHRRVRVMQDVTALVLGAVYALVALGYTLVYGVLRLIASRSV